MTSITTDLFDSMNSIILTSMTLWLYDLYFTDLYDEDSAVVRLTAGEEGLTKGQDVMKGTV